MDALVARGPDPQAAGARLSRFVEAGGDVPRDEDGQALLAALFGSGGFLSDIILSDPARWPQLCADPFLRREKPRETFVTEMALVTDGVAGEAALLAALRRYRRREMLRLGARELGWGTTMEVARELAGLADACLELAVAYAGSELSAGFGAPTSSHGTPSFVVMGMGKLGGNELNFSSDVDVIYFYSTDEGRAGSLTLHEYFSRLSLAVTRAMAEPTDDGIVFRVDLRLRPEGRSGPMCNSVLAAEAYYETFGRTWERQAFLRARPSAGDRQLGETLLATLEPFVFPRSVGPEAIDEVRGLRRLFREEVEGPAFDVKLSEGGIRDVELVAQLLQLLWGGKRKNLRERSTLPALRKLWLAGFLSTHEERELGTAYKFWRQVEHRVQLENAAQIHRLPSDPEGLGKLSRSLGFTGTEDFLATVERHRRAVSAVSETLGEPAGGPPAIVLRLLDPVRNQAAIRADLEAAGFVNLEESASTLEHARVRMPPEWLAEAIASPDPDRALARFRDLALGGSGGLRQILRADPQLLRMLASLFGTSDRLSRYLVTNPALWESLLRDLGDPRPPAAAFEAALTGRLQGLDGEEALREMRRYKTAELLRLGLHDVAGNLEPHEVSAQLSHIAEACLGATTLAMARGMTARHGLPDAELTILAMGSLGAREMRYGSDLDLVFLFERDGATDRGVSHQEYFARLAQRIIGSLGTLLDEGRLYEVDTRLRPSGNQGMLVTSYAAFAAYHEKDAALWERAALLRARPVFSRNLVQGTRSSESFAERLRAIAYRDPVDGESLRAELRRMRDRIERERAHKPDGSVHVRLSAGGLTDCEFMAAYVQLTLGKSQPELQTTSPYEALAATLAAKLLPLDAHILDDYRVLARAGMRIRLLRNVSEDRIRPEDVAPLARTLGVAEADLGAQLRHRMQRIRGTFTRVLGGAS
jgi:glutamate-ammonia-ligase adenylyltransferase